MSETRMIVMSASDARRPAGDCTAEAVPQAVIGQIPEAEGWSPDSRNKAVSKSAIFLGCAGCPPAAKVKRMGSKKPAVVIRWEVC